VACETDEGGHRDHGAKEHSVLWHCLPMKERRSGDVAFQEGECASCDGDLILPWYVGQASLLRRTIAGIVCTIVIIVVPRKVAIDEAGNRDGT